MPKNASLVCSYCDEPIEDGQRFVSFGLSASNPWRDEPEKIVNSELAHFHRDHAEEMIVVYNYLKFGGGGDHLEIKHHHAGGAIETVIGDEA